MGAAVVQREDMPALVHEKDRAMAAVHNKSALGFQLLKSARAHEVRGLSIHGGSSSKLSAATPFSKGPPRFVNPASDVPLRPISVTAPQHLAGHGSTRSNCIRSLYRRPGTATTRLLEQSSSPPLVVTPSSKKAAPVMPHARAAIGPASQARIIHREELTTTSLGTSATDLVNPILSEI
jgi:hypothetical protein